MFECPGPSQDKVQSLAPADPPAKFSAPVVHYILHMLGRIIMDKKHVSV